MNWHQQEIRSVFDTLKSSESGLTEADVITARAEHGPNELTAKKTKSAFAIFIGQFRDIMTLILIAAAIVSGIIGDAVDTIIIMVIVMLNAILGFVQEYRAEKTMEALRKMAAPHATVLRDGSVSEIPTSEIVPGDIVHLETGQLVPADIRLFETHSLRIEEATLTGESAPVDKIHAVLETEDLPLGDRLNMAYKATKVVNGRGKGIVTGTGMNTEVGKIAGMLQEEETRTPLQTRMADFGKKLSFIILGICVLLFVSGILRGEQPIEILLVAITLGVAAIPEALPALITIALAGGAKQLAKQNVVVRKLPAVETLGSVTYICSDKTGTLTRNEMKVMKVSGEKKEPKEDLSFLEIAMALNHDTTLNEEGKLLGDPTETAMVAYISETYGKEKPEAVSDKYPRTGELPFDSERKLMTTIHSYDGKHLVLTKGAAESIVHILADKSRNSQYEKEAYDMASEGMRVIGFAYRLLDSLPAEVENSNIETDLVYAGLVGMIDPPREEVQAAIKEAQDAGIVSVMITGDHIETASAIAKQIGILTEDTVAISGKEMEALSEAELAEKAEHIRVYARVSPEQKLNIVKALQQRGHYVAMTGDGANDAPSLKTANIGIAMGITGTDVSKEAAHLVLMDDNFATIVKAVREGRRIYDNIRRFIKYIMACNSAEILLILMAPLLGMPTPLLPIHILWINLVTDGLPGLALGSEAEEPDIMKRKPRPTNENMFSRGVGIHIIWMGTFMAAITLGVQHYSIQHDGSHWQTMVFTSLLLCQLGHVFAIRSDDHFIFRKGIFSNPLMLATILSTFLLQLGIIYLPFANKIFRTQPLTLNELLICITLALVVFHAVELEKLIKKGYRKKK